MNVTNSRLDYVVDSRSFELIFLFLRSQYIEKVPTCTLLKPDARLKLVGSGSLRVNSV